MLRARDFRQRAWSALSGKWVNFVVITLLMLLIEAACGALSLIGIGAIALFLITGPLTLGISQCHLKLLRGGDPQIGEMFDGFRNFLSAFLLFLINTIFTFLWSLLFIIPGIVKSYSYSMSYYILADNPNMDANEARKLSMKMMHGNKWRLFCLDLSFIGWILLTAITFGILSLWVTPYMGVARAEFYEELLREQGIINQAQNGGTDNGNNGGNNGNGVQPEQPAAPEQPAPVSDPFTDLSANDGKPLDVESKPAGDGGPLNADDL